MPGSVSAASLAAYSFSFCGRSCWCSLWDVCRESVELSRFLCPFLCRKRVESLCWFVHSSMGECLTCAVFENFRVPLLKVLRAWGAFKNLGVLLLKACSAAFESFRALLLKMLGACRLYRTFESFRALLLKILGANELLLSSRAFELSC